MVCHSFLRRAGPVGALLLALAACSGDDVPAPPAAGDRSPRPSCADATVAGADPCAAASTLPDWTPGTRPLAYGQGRTLHLGTEQVETGLDFLSIDLTDEGAVLTTLDGAVWFTEGGAPRPIGTTRAAVHVGRQGVEWGSLRPRNWVVTDAVGHLAAWISAPAGEQGSTRLAVFESGFGRVLHRVPLDVPPGATAEVVALVDGSAFVGVDVPGEVQRFWEVDLTTGAVPVQATRGDVVAAVLSATRGAHVNEAGPVVGAEQPSAGAPPVSVTLTVRGSLLEPLRDLRAGAPVELRLPTGYGDGNLWFTQWLDDDRFAVVTDAGGEDLLVCRLSARSCVVVASLSLEAPALTPGDGLRGAELALGRAAEAAVADNES